MKALKNAELENKYTKRQMGHLARARSSPLVVRLVRLGTREFGHLNCYMVQLLRRANQTYLTTKNKMITSEDDDISTDRSFRK